MAQFGWIDYLRHRHEITLLTPVHNDAEAAACETLRKLWPEVTMSPVHAPGFGKRPPAWQRAKDWLKNTPPGQAAHRALVRWQNYAPRVESQRIVMLPRYLIAPASAEARRGYDVIQVEYTEFLSMVHALPADVPNLFAQIEIHYVVRDRARSEKSRADAYENYVFAQEKSRELDSLRHYDSVVTMSEYDRSVLQAELPLADIRCSPFAYVNPPGQTSGFQLSPFAQRLVYVGAQWHTPNVDAVEWFLATMWPALSARFPKLEFHVVGEWTAEFRGRYGTSERVVFPGFVADLTEALRGAIMVVPLRVGSGIRTKILMAMTLGVPVVTTSVGVEGIDATDGKELLCADQPEAFVAAVARLVEDQPTADRIATDAHDFIQHRFSQEATGARRDEIWRSLHARHAGASSTAA